MGEAGLAAEVTLLRSLSTLPTDLILGRVDGSHPLRSWLQGRGIPTDHLDELEAYATDVVVTGVDCSPDLTPQVLETEERLVRQVTANHWRAGLKTVLTGWSKRDGKPILVTETSIEGTETPRMNRFVAAVGMGWHQSAFAGDVEGGEMQGMSALVLGGSGQQGGAVARALRARGVRVRAATREPLSTAGRDLAQLGIDPVAVDLSDLTSITAAMKGVSAVFSVQPSSGQPSGTFTDEQEVRAGVAVVDAAERAGVKHLVYSSALAAAAGLTGVRHFDTKVRIERRVMNSPLAWTIVRPATFMEIITGSEDQGSVVRFLMSEGASLQAIATSDIGRVVAEAILDRDRWNGRTIEIAGDSITGRDIAQLLSRRWGHDVRYEQLPLGGTHSTLRRLAALIEEGPLGNGADIPALRQTFPGLITFEQWLRQSTP